MSLSPQQPCTLAARSGVDQDVAHGSVMPPLYLSSNYAFEGFDRKGGWSVTFRDGTITPARATRPATFSATRSPALNMGPAASSPPPAWPP